MMGHKTVKPYRGRESQLSSIGSSAGFVSIFTVLIIMAVLALITVGFSAITRNAQRRTLDNQLNTQAFYAAESGINDVRQFLATPAGAGVNKNTCQGAIGGFSYNNNLDATLGVGYTCVLINSTPPDIRFDSVPVEGTGNPKVVPFESSNNQPITSFRINWSGVNGTPNIPTNTGYPNILRPSGGHSTDLGMVRVDLVPASSGFDRGTMIPQSYTFFVYPSGVINNPSGGAISGTADQGGLLVPQAGQCSSLPCRTTISISGTSSSKYIMRLQALYNPINVTIDNLQTSAGATNFQNAQAVVDVTGKANDVYRRVQARLPFQPRGLTPAFALQTADSICKVLLVQPGDTHPDPSYISPNGACAIN